jgi:hypothetical protein
MHQILEINKPKTLSADADTWDPRGQRPHWPLTPSQRTVFDHRFLAADEVFGEGDGTNVLPVPSRIG